MDLQQPMHTVPSGNGPLSAVLRSQCFISLRILRNSTPSTSFPFKSNTTEIGVPFPYRASNRLCSSTKLDTKWIEYPASRFFSNSMRWAGDSQSYGAKNSSFVRLLGSSAVAVDWPQAFNSAKLLINSALCPSRFSCSTMSHISRMDTGVRCSSSFGLEDIAIVIIILGVWVCMYYNKKYIYI